jgi:hypothetical protein
MSKKRNTEYSVVAYIRGNYFPLQRALERRFGLTDGSGYCFIDGERDLEWTRKTSGGAIRLRTLIKMIAASLKKRVRVEVVTY